MMVLREVSKRGSRTGLHLRRIRGEHHDERLNGARLRDSVLVLGIALGHLLQRIRRESAQLHEGVVLVHCTPREAGHQAHELRDSTRARHNRLIVLRVAAELLNRPNRVLFRLI